MKGNNKRKLVKNQSIYAASTSQLFFSYSSYPEIKQYSNPLMEA